MNRCLGLWSFIDRRAVIVNDGIRRCGNTGIGGLLAIWLGAAPKSANSGADDAQRRRPLPQRSGTCGSACWPVLEATGKRHSAAGDKPGILVAIETKRAVQLALQNATCQPVWAGSWQSCSRPPRVAPLRALMMKPRFSPEINFGHLIAGDSPVLTVSGGAVTSYISLRGDIENLRSELGVQLASHELRIAAAERALEQRRVDERDFQAEMRSALRGSIDDLSPTFAPRSCKSRIANNISAPTVDPFS